MKTIEITSLPDIEAVIRRCPYCMVGFATPDGTPYVVPMNFAYADGEIYLHSGPTGSKVDMARRDPRVCVTFCEGSELVWMHRQVACSYGMKSRSVVCQGTLSAVDDLAEKRRILHLLMAHYTDQPCTMGDPAVRHVLVWRVRVERLCCRSFGLKPSEL